MLIKLILPSIPQSLNTILRMHWIARKRMQDHWDVMVWTEWIRHERLIFNKPVKIKYIITFLKKRVRDYDNYIGGTKFITDSLKRTFLVRDDAEWLRNVSVEFKRGDTWQTEVLIEEVDDDKRKDHKH